jgi:hypothetical protein
MPTLPLVESPEAADQAHETARRLAEAVCRNVMAALGRPRDLYHVAALRLWDNHYRVNVFTGADAVSALIADSFFVSADDRGNVLNSRPKVTRKYGPTGGSGANGLQP